MSSGIQGIKPQEILDGSAQVPVQLRVWAACLHCFRLLALIVYSPILSPSFHQREAVKGIVSHAQNFEDVALWRALGQVERGFYVDIGAYDPIDTSVSLAFYEQGWRGLHVEPLPEYADRLRRERPDETVIEAAVGDHDGEITLWEATDRAGCSTCDPKHAEQLQSQGHSCRTRTVRCLTMDHLLAPYAERPIHWLKIDVEGAESAVIRGWSARAVRPWVLVIEATAPNRPELTHQAWEPDLLAKRYRFAYFDGLNRFYVAEEHQALASRLNLPPNWFDGFTLGDLHPLVASRVAQLKQATREQARLTSLLAEQRALVAHYRDSLSWRITAPMRFLFRQIRRFTCRISSYPAGEPAVQPTKPSTPSGRAFPTRLRRRLVQVADHPTTIRAVRPVLLLMPGLRRRLQGRLVRLRGTTVNPGVAPATPDGAQRELSADAARVFRALQRATARRLCADAATDAHSD